MNLNNLAVCFTTIFLLNAYLADCQNNWNFLENSYTSAETENIKENKFENDDWLEKKTNSLNPDRELISNLVSKTQTFGGKNLIELRKDLQEQLEFLERYENELDDLRKLVYQQKSRNKRPSVYYPVSYPKKTTYRSDLPK